MKHRIIYDYITYNLSRYPVLAVTGPRQSGKTTFLRSTFEKYRYVTLENPDMRSYAKQDTKGFLKEFDKYVIFDEAQQVPELFSYIQGIVDESQIMGQFIISGSQNFHLMQSISQSLAGRVALFRLYPFDLSEMHEAKWLTTDLSEALTKGFYPAIFQRDVNPDKYYADYIKTYVSRDISQLINVQNDRAFSRFIKICATRAGQLVNFNNLARDAGISHTTARNWLSILETSYIIFFLQPYFKNYGKRLIKSPKLYFCDTGLLAHLLNIRNSKLSQAHQSWGQLFENMIVSDLIKQNYHRSLEREYWFWRDSHGHEIDVLYNDSEALHLFEIKASQTIKPEMFQQMDYFERLARDTIGSKHVIYGGQRKQKRTAYQIVPWRKLETNG